MLFLLRSAPEVEKRIHSKLFCKFLEEPGYKRAGLHYCNIDVNIGALSRPELEKYILMTISILFTNITPQFTFKWCNITKVVILMLILANIWLYFFLLDMKEVTAFSNSITFTDCLWCFPLSHPTKTLQNFRFEYIFQIQIFSLMDWIVNSTFRFRNDDVPI